MKPSYPLACLGMALFWAVAARAQPDPDTVFRPAFSSQMFTEVSVQDAKASLKAWVLTVAGTRGVAIDDDPVVVDGLPALVSAWQSGRINSITLTLPDYHRLSSVLRFDHIFMTTLGGRASEEYVLLAHRKSGLSTLGELAGKRLVLFRNPRTCLAVPWLDLELSGLGLRPTRLHFGPIKEVTKVSAAVLPVFFEQQDACLVTRRGLALMTELNPQTGQLLQVVASSPEFVPGLLGLRAGYHPPFKQELLEGLRELHTTPAGKQMLTLAQSDQLQEYPVEALAPSLDLLARHDRVFGPGASPAPPQPTSRSETR